MKKRTATILKGASLVAGIVVVAFGVLYVVLLVAANRKLHRAYAALEADGRPMKAEQIIPPPVADGDNGALLYQAAVLKLKSGSGGGDEQNLFERLGTLGSNIVAQGSPVTKAEVNEFRTLIADPLFAEALAIWESGLDKPHCRYDLDYSLGPGILLPHLSEMRGLSTMICATALIKAQDGDGEGAWRLIENHFRFADALRTEPLLVTQLVRMAQFGIGEGAMRQIAAISLPTEARSTGLDRALRAFEALAPFTLAMDGERLLVGEWVFDYLSRLSLFGQIRMLEQMGCVESPDEVFARRTWHGVLFNLVLTPLQRCDHAMYLTILHAQTRASTMQYGPKKDTEGDEMAIRIPRRYIITWMLVPALSRVRGRYVSMIAQAGVARAGLAVLQHHRQHGRFPETLATTGQAFPDPFSGKELVYRHDDAGFIIYSIGQNQVDDNGRKETTKYVDRQRTEREDVGCDDLAWEWTPPGR